MQKDPNGNLYLHLYCDKDADVEEFGRELNKLDCSEGSGPEAPVIPYGRPDTSQRHNNPTSIQKHHPKYEPGELFMDVRCNILNFPLEVSGAYLSFTDDKTYQVAKYQVNEIDTTRGWRITKQDTLCQVEFNKQKSTVA